MRALARYALHWASRPLRAFAWLRRRPWLLALLALALLLPLFWGLARYWPAAAPDGTEKPLSPREATWQAEVAYVKQYAPIAVAEMRRYGIPASITLGQGILESNAGRSGLAVNNNNHFGIKCFRKDCPKGHCSNHDDDHHKDFFRIYPSVWASYRDHSLFLQKERYRPLFKLPAGDYKAWAKGLKAAGYATDPKYADKLIAKIEAHRLHEYDR